MADKPVKELSNKDYAKLGELLVSLGQLGLTEKSKQRMMRYAFLKGVVNGIGSVLGATVAVALLLWVLSIFDSVPLIGGFLDSIEATIERR